MSWPQHAFLAKANFAESTHQGECCLELEVAERFSPSDPDPASRQWYTVRGRQEDFLELARVIVSTFDPSREDQMLAALLRIEALLTPNS